MLSRDNIRVHTYLAEWLHFATSSVEHTTAVNYRQHVKHLTRLLGQRYLSKLDVTDVRDLHDRLLAEGYAASTVQVIHTVLHHALKNAMARGLIARNVSELVRSPKVRWNELATLTPEEARILRQRDGRFRVLWTIALATGMRLGELIALRWKDINLARGVLSVSRSAYVQTGVGMVLKSPKTDSSRRTILLPGSVVTELKARRAHQNEERLLAGDLWADLDIVFCTEMGRLYEPTVIRREFYLTPKEASLPHIRLHDMRHTAATLLLERGMNVKAVSDFLGHADPAVTLRVYAHATHAMQEQLASEMGDILFG